MHKLIICVICIVFVVEAAPQDEVVHRMKQLLSAIDSGAGAEGISPLVSKDFVLTDGGYSYTGNDAVDMLVLDAEDSYTGDVGVIVHNLNEDMVKTLIPNKLLQARGMFEYDEDDDGELDYCGSWIGLVKRDDDGKYRINELVYSDELIIDNDDPLCVIDDFPVERGSSEFYDYDEEYYDDEEMYSTEIYESPESSPESSPETSPEIIEEEIESAEAKAEFKK